MGNHQGTRWRGKLPIPEHAHPLVKQFIHEANVQKTVLSEVAKRAGMSAGTISGWRYTSIPRLDLFEAALNTLDLELVVRPRRREKQGEVV